MLVSGEKLVISEEILRVTHQGHLSVADKELNCAVLEDGTRVLTSTAIFKAFSRPSRGNARVIGIPVFMDAKNLQPFINADLKEQIKRISYITKTGKLATGYKAEALPLICDVYLSARNSGVLTSSQQPLALAAEMLVRSLSKVGIVALIDEATGYQEARKKDALQQLLAIYLNEERLKWAKMFPDEFYRQLFRLKNWQYNPIDVRRPKIVGKLTNQLVYEKLPPTVLDELRKFNPVKNKRTWRREAAHHQHLSEEIGQKDLRDHLLQLIAIMRISPNWGVFQRNFARAFPGSHEQTELSLREDEDEE